MQRDIFKTAIIETHQDHALYKDKHTGRTIGLAVLLKKGSEPIGQQHRTITKQD